LRHDLTWISRHPAVSRGRCTGASSPTSADLSRDATNSKGRRAGILQVDRSGQAGRSFSFATLAVWIIFGAVPCERSAIFLLNTANPLAANLLMREGLERLTVSYDLNAQQVIDLLRAAPPHWFELDDPPAHADVSTWSNCVFAAFLSNGTDATNCGDALADRPREAHDNVERDDAQRAKPCGLSRAETALR